MSERRIVNFIKDGVDFGASKVTLQGFVVFGPEHEQDEDFPDPLPHEACFGWLFDNKGKAIIGIGDWKALSYFLDGHDQSLLSASGSRSHNDLLELEWGHG